MKPVQIRNQALVLLFSAFMVCSCTHYYYVPNAQNVPLFKEKNEYRLSANYGLGDESSCAEIQAAYSPTSNIGITANFISAQGQDRSRPNKGQGYYIEGAAGYYRPLSNSAVFEIYGGLGSGNQHHTYYDIYNNQSNGTSGMSFNRLFVQPSIGLAFDEFDIAFSTRICKLSFYGIKNNIFNNTFEYDALRAISGRNYFFAEPAITVRGGYKNFKVQCQGVFSGNLNSPPGEFGEEFHFSIGMYFTIAERYRSNHTNTGK